MVCIFIYLYLFTNNKVILVLYSKKNFAIAPNLDLNFIKNIFNYKNSDISNTVLKKF